MVTGYGLLNPVHIVNLPHIRCSAPDMVPYPLRAPDMVPYPVPYPDILWPNPVFGAESGARTGCGMYYPVRCTGCGMYYPVRAHRIVSPNLPDVACIIRCAAPNVERIMHRMCHDVLSGALHQV